MNFIVRCMLFLILVSISSCTHIVLFTYGVKNERHPDEAAIARGDRHLGIHTSAVLNEKYPHALDSLHVPAKLKKDMKQPLQFWLVTRNEVVCNIVNCYASGYPNLKWHLDGLYHQQKVNSPVEDKQQFIDNIPPLYHVNTAGDDSVAIICYAYTMGRQNKHLIKCCKHFLGAHPGVKAYYINVDNIY